MARQPCCSILAFALPATIVFAIASAAEPTELEAQLLAANGNITILRTAVAPAWATTSNIRSTANLLWTCVLTLLVCVYTVIHINILGPESGSRSWWRPFSSKAKWILIAILAPELALTAAAQQWSAARDLRHELNRIYAEKNPPARNSETAAIPTRFGMPYCFYVVMGGFVLEVPDMNGKPLKLTLQPRGIILLAKEGRFLEMPERAINDRSKAGSMAKVLACLQIFWMLVECIGRAAAKLPVSLLEMHVLVHVVCALCMYAFWILKPLDIQDPTVVETSEFPNTAALMAVEYYDINVPWTGIYENGDLVLYDPLPKVANASSNVKVVSNDQNLPVVAEMNAVQSQDLKPHQQGTAAAAEEKLTLSPPRGYIEFMNPATAVDNGNPVEAFSDASSIHRDDWEAIRAGEAVYLRPGQALACGLGFSTEASPTMVSANRAQLWTMIADAVRNQPEPYLNPETRQLFLKKSSVLERSQNIRLDYIQQSPSQLEEQIRNKLGDLDLRLLGMIFGLPLIYGGVHLSAWNFQFATETERIMWRVSGIMAAIGIPGTALIVYSILLLISKAGRRVGGRRVRCLSTVWEFFEWGVLFVDMLVIVGMATLYVAARLFLLIESFISIRNMPLGVYLTLDWADFIPHL